MKKTVIIVLSFLLALSIMGCAGRREKAAEEIAEKIVEKKLEDQGIDANVEKDGEEITIKTDEGEMTIKTDMKWPDETPKDIPIFNKGEIESTANAMGGVIINFSNVSYNDVIDYISALEQNKWQEMLNMKSDGQVTFAAMKDGIQLTVDWTGSDMIIAWMNVGE